MASQFDESDFVDSDFVATQKTFTNPGFAHASMSVASNPPSHSAPAPAAAPHPMNRPPSREELESKVNETQARLAELRRAQELLERERSALEEARRKRIEFQNGREEMLEHLTRGIGILEEAEFNARRNSEQMKLTVADMRTALDKVHGMNEEGWTEETWQHELTKALTTLENARMEWNSARVKWTILDGALTGAEDKKVGGLASFASGKSFAELCKLGLALTWPVAAAALIGIVVITAVLLLRK